MEAIVCPSCGGGLTAGETWVCGACGASYRALRGIPDLRKAEDHFLSNAEDWQLALRLNDDFDRLDFRGLLERYYDAQPEIPPDRRRRQRAHILSATGRAAQWLEAIGPGARGLGPILDLGCGPGGFLIAAASLVGDRPLWGLDIAMRWLVLARKRLDEAGLGHVRLVCGCGEALPFADGTFAGIVAGDVIEHVADQSATLGEAYRVLRPGSRIVLATPNRFSLAPEPHVGVWGVGFLPRSWMGRYVRLVRGLDYRAIRTLGLGEWRRLLAATPFQLGSISAPGLPAAELVHFSRPKRALGQAYNQIVGTTVGQAVGRWVGPLLHLVCTRECGPLEAPAFHRVFEHTTIADDS